MHFWLYADNLVYNKVQLFHVRQNWDLLIVLLGASQVTKWQFRRPGFNPWVRKILWRRKWQPTPVFLPGKSHGQRSLVGYSSWSHKSRTQLMVSGVMYGCQVDKEVHLWWLILHVNLALWNAQILGSNIILDVLLVFG